MVLQSLSRSTSSQTSLHCLPLRVEVRTEAPTGEPKHLSETEKDSIIIVFSYFTRIESLEALSYSGVSRGSLAN